MHLLLVTFDAPQILSGEALSSAFGPGTLALPGDSVGSPALVKESSITLSVMSQSPAGVPNQAAPLAVWQSQVEAPGWVGDRFMLRLVAGKMADSALSGKGCPELMRAIARELSKK